MQKKDVGEDHMVWKDYEGVIIQHRYPQGSSKEINY